jgi:hypothetical protein
VSKRPSFQFYPADWRKDAELQSCGIAARGLWHEMMCLAHECEPYGHLAVNSRPMSHEQISRLCGVTMKEFRVLYAELDRAGVPSKTNDGVIYSRRMDRDEKERGQWRDRQRDKRDKSPSGHGDVTPESRPSSSSTSSSSSEGKTSLRSVVRKKALNGSTAPPKPVPKTEEPQGFAAFYALFPIKTSRGSALKNYAAALKKLPAAALFEAAKRYLKSREGEDHQYTKRAHTWLRDGCWADELPLNPDDSAPLDQPLNGAPRPFCTKQPDETREHFLVRRFRETGLWLAPDGAPPDNADTCMPRPILREFGYTQKDDREREILADREQRARA